MRFLHVNHRYSPFEGGSERWVQEVSEALVRGGHEVAVVTTNAFDLEYFWDKTRTTVDAAQVETINGVHVERVPVRHLPFSSIGFRGMRRLMGEAAALPMPAAPYRAASYLQPLVPALPAALKRAGAVDLVLGTNVGLESLALRALACARERQAAFVMTPFIHLGVDGDPVARRYVSMPHQRELIRAADAVMVMTEVEREFVEGFRAGKGRVAVAGAGVRTSEVTGGNGAAFRNDIGARGFLVGAIGAMAQDKGTVDLAEAMIDLRRAGHDVELVLAGPPLASFVRWYTELTDEECEGIHLMGFVSTEVKRNMLAAIDVLALPSRTESFGIVYLEAWANQKPVIAADTPATRELVADQETGLLVPFGNRESIGDAVLRLKRSDELRSRMGQRGRETVERHHTWRHVVERVSAVYTEVLGVDIGNCVE